MQQHIFHGRRATHSSSRIHRPWRSQERAGAGGGEIPKLPRSSLLFLARVPESLENIQAKHPNNRASSSYGFAMPVLGCPCIRTASVRLRPQLLRCVENSTADPGQFAAITAGVCCVLYCNLGRAPRRPPGTVVGLSVPARLNPSPSAYPSSNRVRR